MESPDTNPKTAFGQVKPGIHAIPPVALLHCGRGMENGEVKYGLTNWREHEVSASVYYNAAFRHFGAWWDGEQCAADSGVHHLGHVMACCAILLDAEHMGKLNDNRPAIPGPFAEAVKAMTRPMENTSRKQPCEEEGCDHVETLTVSYLDGSTEEVRVVTRPVENTSRKQPCEDEGCDHAGTPHVCIDVCEVAARIMSTRDVDEAAGILRTFLRGDWGSDDPFGEALGDPIDWDADDEGGRG